MRLLQVVHYPFFGGPHNQALRLREALLQNDWETLVLIPDEPGNAAQRLRDGGVETITMPLGRLRASPNLRIQARSFGGFYPNIRRIRRLIAERDIDLVVVGGLVNPHAAIAARLERIPVVWQLLDTRSPMLLRRAVMPVVRRLADVVMTTGMEIARVHPGAMAFRERLVPFFPPVDCSTFRPDSRLREPTRACWGVTGNDFVIGCVGNINPQKGIENLIAAFGLVRPGLPRAKLVLVGAEYDTHRDYSQALRLQIAQLGLREGSDVVFAGASSDAERVLQGFDVFVQGSVPNSEGIPTAILEAMACGLPVISTDVGGVREAIQDGVNGVVVPPLQPQRIANAVLELAENDSSRQQMAAAARARAEQQFDLHACAETHLRAFEAALSHHKAAA